MRNLKACQNKAFSNPVVEVGVPVRALDASGQRGTNTGSGADADASLEHGRCMTNTSYYILVNR